ncbi:hypothetical protein L4C36_00575 [Photobacterium japonica]
MQLFGKVVVFITVLLSFINTMSKSPSVNAWLNGESRDLSFGYVALVFAIIVGVFIALLGLAIWLSKILKPAQDEINKKKELIRAYQQNDSDQTKK